MPRPPETTPNVTEAADSDPNASAQGSGLHAQAGDPALPPGTNVGRYVILGRLGGGGMGVVYAAFDPELDRKVALKLLAPSLLESGRSDEFQARLLREARAMARVSHPNVIAVHDAGTFHTHVFIAMDLVEGGLTLRDWQREEGRSWRAIRDLYLQAGRGLAAAHAAGLIHRDFKPDNVLVGRDGKVCVTDFGLARPAGLAEEDPTQVDPPPLTPSQATPLNLPATEIGAVLGTPGYMAPEQLASATLVEARSDQFAFCAALYEALYGFRPFEGKTVLEFGREMLARRIREPPADTKVPVRIRRLLLRGLSRRREDRFDSMDELMAQLARDPQLTRRRWLVGGASAFTAIAAAIGTAYGVSVRQSHVCEGAALHWANVWDAPRQLVIHAAFSASKKPYAQDAWRAVHDSLDAFVGGWIGQHTDACRATRVRGEQSDEMLGLRMACLGRLRTQAQTLTKVFAEADDAVIEKSVQAVSDLPDPKLCGDVVSLASRVRVPQTDAQRQEVRALRDRLSEATALHSAGKEDAALEIAKTVTAKAEGVGYAPLSAEALTLRGRLEWLQAGDYRQSEKTLWESVWAAEEGRDDEAAARAWTELVYVEGNRLSKTDDGLRAARHAQALLHSLGDSPDIQMSLFTNEGGLFIATGKYPEAEKSFTDALNLAKVQYTEDHPNRARALSNVADAQMRQGKYEPARELFLRALEILEKRFGRFHPRIVPALTGLGNISLKQGREDAVTFHGRALEILEGALHPTHPWLSETIYNLGVAYVVTGDQDRAQQLLQRSLALDTLNLGASDPVITGDLTELAESEIKQGRYPAALKDLQRATGILRAHSGEEDIRDAPVLSLTGQALAAQRMCKQALAYFDRALALRTKELSAQSSELAPDLARSGDCLLELGNHTAARSSLRRALALWEGSNPAPDQIGRIQFSLAQSLWTDRAQQPGALELARKARENLSLAGANAPADLRRVEAWLSERAR